MNEKLQELGEMDSRTGPLTIIRILRGTTEEGGVLAVFQGKTVYHFYLHRRRDGRLAASPLRDGSPLKKWRVLMGNSAQLAIALQEVARGLEPRL